MAGTVLLRFRPVSPNKKELPGSAAVGDQIDFLCGDFIILTLILFFPRAIFAIADLVSHRAADRFTATRF